MAVSTEDIKETRDKLSTASGYADLVCLGCPHASLEEIKDVANFVCGKVFLMNFGFVLQLMLRCTDRMGYTKMIENAGGHIVQDTCMVVAPIEDMDMKVLVLILQRQLIMFHLCVSKSNLQ